VTDQHRSGESREAALRQLVIPLLVTLVSVAMLVGSFYLARLETTPLSLTSTRATARRTTLTPFLPTLTPPPTVTVPDTPTRPMVTPAEATAGPERHTATPMPPPPQSSTPTAIPMQATYPAVAPPQVLPTAPYCTRPPGWIFYTVQAGDTLTRLARISGTTTVALMRGNCLATTTLFRGQKLYLPPAFYVSPTPEPYPCGPPFGWVEYVVQPGDTLYGLSQRFDVPIEILRQANCLQTNAIYLGQTLYVPPHLPTLTTTPSITPTIQATPTTVAPTPTTTATASASPAPTVTPTTPSATVTGTPAPASSTPTATTIPSSTPSSTWTPLPTATFTPSPTYTPTPSPTATSTPTSTPPESSAAFD